MGKTGPKPSEGDRFPCGRLKTQAKFAGTPPAQIRRALDQAMKKATDPRLGSSVGMLRIEEKITIRQASAAMSYAELRGRFHKVMGFRPRTAASPSYEQGYGWGGGAEDETKILRTRRDHARMMRLYSPSEQSVLDRYCIDDERPASFEIPDFVRLLNKIADHFVLRE